MALLPMIIGAVAAAEIGRRWRGQPATPALPSAARGSGSALPAEDETASGGAYAPLLRALEDDQRRRSTAAATG
eukprot:6263951-Pyramimonas_sp.AAC.1